MANITLLKQGLSHIPNGHVQMPFPSKGSWKASRPSVKPDCTVPAATGRSDSRCGCCPAPGEQPSMREDLKGNKQSAKGAVNLVLKVTEDDEV